MILIILIQGRNPLNSEVKALVAELGGEKTLVDKNQATTLLKTKKFKRPQEQERDMREAFKVCVIEFRILRIS